MNWNSRWVMQWIAAICHYITFSPAFFFEKGFNLYFSLSFNLKGNVWRVFNNLVLSPQFPLTKQFLHQAIKVEISRGFIHPSLALKFLHIITAMLSYTVNLIVDLPGKQQGQHLKRMYMNILKMLKTTFSSLPHMLVVFMTLHVYFL